MFWVYVFTKQYDAINIFYSTFHWSLLQWQAVVMPPVQADAARWQEEERLKKLRQQEAGEITHLLGADCKKIRIYISLTIAVIGFREIPTKKNNP